MTDDLVKRLRDGCSCNIDSSPCMAEEECRDAYAAADRIEALEAKLAKAVEALEHIAGNGNAVGRNPQIIADIARATLAELTGGKDE